MGYYDVDVERGLTVGRREEVREAAACRVGQSLSTYRGTIILVIAITISRLGSSMFDSMDSSLE